MTNLRRVVSPIARFIRERYYRMALDKILASANAHPAPPNQLFGDTSDYFWFWLNTEGYRRIEALRKLVPGMPDEDLQRHFTGAAGDVTLWEGFSAYNLFKRIFEDHAGRPVKASKILDYGCGWGRILRFFLRDVDPAMLWGVDGIPEMIAVCKQTNRWCNFDLVSTRPPTLFQADAFDLIYCYSVFSHLSEEIHTQLLTEFKRILKPGGVLIITTRDREFIKHCAELRKDPNLSSLPDWQKVSAVAFPDPVQSLSDYDNGKYCFTPFGEEEWSFSGKLVSPRSIYWSSGPNILTSLILSMIVSVAHRT